MTRPSSRSKIEPEDAEYRLPRPSIRVPLSAMIGAGIGFAALATQMSDVGHATGAAIGAFVFFIGAAYIALATR